MTHMHTLTHVGCLKKEQGSKVMASFSSVCVKQLFLRQVCKSYFLKLGHFWFIHCGEIKLLKIAKTEYIFEKSVNFYYQIAPFIHTPH